MNVLDMYFTKIAEKEENKSSGRPVMVPGLIATGLGTHFARQKTKEMENAAEIIGKHKSELDSIKDPVAKFRDKQPQEQPMMYSINKRNYEAKQAKEIAKNKDLRETLGKSIASQEDLIQKAKMHRNVYRGLAGLGIGSAALYGAKKLYDRRNKGE